MEYIFIFLSLFVSLEASEDIFTHLYAIYSNHLPELLLLILFLILPSLATISAHNISIQTALKDDKCREEFLEVSFSNF